MLATAVLMPLGAFAAMQARLDLLIHHHSRAALEAFYIAESGLEHALADLACDPRFDRLAVGPDGRAGTPDDGEFPFRGGSPGFFLRQPLGYSVRVEVTGPDAVEIVSRGCGVGRAAREVAASVVASPAPYLPAAVFSAAPAISLQVGESFLITGVPDGAPGEGVPALAAEQENAVDVILSGLSESAKTRLRGEGGTPSVRARSFPEMAGLAAAFPQLPGVEFLAPEVTGPIGTGLRMSQQSTHITDVEGSGILLVDGGLRVAGRFVFSGIILVLGDVEFDRNSEVMIDGALLQGPSGERMHFPGSGAIAYDPYAAAVMDAALPGLLPHRAVVTGWREHL